MDPGAPWVYVGRITGKDSKAVGAQWVLGPVLDMYQQPLWSRTYETFGEDPYMIAQMGSAAIEAIQGPDPRFPQAPPAAATMKHFLAYGNVVGGHDRAPVDVSDRLVRQWYLPAFVAAVKADGASKWSSRLTMTLATPLPPHPPYVLTK